MKLNRVFALVLTLCMLFSLAQFPVSAEEIYFEASGEIFTYANAVYSDASASGVDDEGYTVYAVSLPTKPVFSQSEYYAKSLTSYQKPIYRAVMDAFCGISANSLKLKQKVEVSYTTEYTTTITSQEQFNTFVNNKLNEEAQKLDLQTLYNAVQYDHTELFWMQGVSGGTSVGASYDGSVATLDWTIIIASDASDLFASDAALRTAATSMNTVVNSILTSTPTTSEYDKLVYFNKWLKDNNTYNNTHLENNNYPLAHGAYSAFTSNNNEPTGPVCQGYAYALKYLCDRIGIHSVIVTGMLYQSYSSPGPHAWNAVEIDGNWYAIDTTANDGLGTDEYNFLVGSNTPSHDSNYFTFSSSHVNDTIHNYPTLAYGRYEPEIVDPLASLFDYTVDVGEVTITAYKGTDTDVKIPEEIGGYPVVEIGKRAFEGNTTITSVTMPDSITTISEYAFNSCSALKTVNMSKGIKTIDDFAFVFCKKLKSIELPNGLTEIGNDAFSGCNSLTSIIIPDTVTTLRSGVFIHCTGLQTAVVGSGVKTIPIDTFYNCKALTTITLPASIENIGVSAFSGCTALTDVYYFGTASSKEAIVYDDWNTCIIDATWHYVLCDQNGHTYTNNCDADCNVCGTIRVIIGHIYDNDCDPDCNVCGATREIEHVYDNACDLYCNVCSSQRLKLVGEKISGLDSSNVLLSYPYQRYGNDLSTMFDGDTTAVDGNGMQLNWSASTDAKTIVISLDEPTDLAGLNIFWGNNDWNAVPAQTYKIYLAREGEVTSDSPAVYSFSNDLTNQDGVLRDDFITFSEVEENVVEIHIKVSAHYKKGDLAIRELEILEATYVPVQEPDHIYNNNCDADCNECGATRTVPDHIYDTNCDADCNECGATRTVPDHIYDNAYDPDCNECGDIREVDNPNAPKFIVESKTVKVGDTFTVTVSINDNSGIIGLRAYLGYDSNLLELVSIEKGEAFADTSFGPLTQNPMSILWDGSLEENSTENGILATLTFKVKETAEAGTTALAISYEPQDIYDSNWDNVYFETEDGTVTIITYISGDVNGDGFVNNKDFGILRQYLNGWSVTVDTLAADVNRDGFVNNKDMGILRQYLNGWDVTLK